MSATDVDRNRAIVELHVVGGHNLSEIAELYGLTRERIRQIVKGALGHTLTYERYAANRAVKAGEREERRAARLAYRTSLDWIRDRSAVDENGCWIWQLACYPTGYGHVSDRNRGAGYAHRRAWELANGAIPTDGPRLCVCHKCDVPACVNPDHLFLGTHRENVHDSMRKGRRPVRRPELLAETKVAA